MPRVTGVKEKTVSIGGFRMQLQVGDGSALRMLTKMTRTGGKKALRRAMAESRKRIKAEIVRNLSGALVFPDTGQTLEAFRRAKFGDGGSRGDNIRIGIIWPTRSELGIGKNDRFYYPLALEYGYTRADGTTVRPYPFLRWAIDHNEAQERATIGRRVGRLIVQEAKRSAR